MTGIRAAIRSQEWLLALLVASAFAPACFALVQVWSTVDYYSHGFLVPLVAYWAATRSRSRFALAAERDRRGIAAAAAATAVYVLGLGSGSVSLQGLSVVGVVTACVLYLGGAAGLRALAFPLAFLLFMVPLPPDWLTPTIVQLQLMVSSAAVELMGWFGSGVVRHGNVIALPAGDSLFVAEACSGITSLVTLTPLAVVLAYFTEPSLRRQVAMVIAVVPAAMLGNLLRVVTTVAYAERYGAERATQNWLHESAGLITFGLACVALIGLGALMRRLSPEPRT